MQVLAGTNIIEMKLHHWIPWKEKAARFIVTDLLDKLELHTLELRREVARLSMLYKIHIKQAMIDIPE